MLRSRLLVLPALAALALTACGGASEPAAPPGPVADVLIRAAATQTTGAGSSKFALTGTTAIGGQEVTFAVEGTYDYAQRIGQLSFDVPPAAGQPAGGTIEQRIIGNDLYLMLPQQPGVFYKLLVSDVAGTLLGNSTDPTVALQALAGVSDVKKVGANQVRGIQATHYQGEYDVVQASAKAEGAAKAILDSTLGQFALEKVPFDAYLDGEGRLVKFEQRLELPASAQTGGQALSSTFSIELFDFGTPVTVVAPAAESVRDGAPLLDALKAAALAPSAAPTPASPAASPAG